MMFTRCDCARGKVISFAIVVVFVLAVVVVVDTNSANLNVQAPELLVSNTNQSIDIQGKLVPALSNRFNAKD